MAKTDVSGNGWQCMRLRDVENMGKLAYDLWRVYRWSLEHPPLL